MLCLLRYFFLPCCEPGAGRQRTLLRARRLRARLHCASSSLLSDAGAAQSPEQLCSTRNTLCVEVLVPVIPAEPLTWPNAAAQLTQLGAALRIRHVWVSAADLNRECGLQLRPRPEDRWLWDCCGSSWSHCPSAACTSLTTPSPGQILWLISKRFLGCGQLRNRSSALAQKGCFLKVMLCAYLSLLQIHGAAQVC